MKPAAPTFRIWRISRDRGLVPVERRSRDSLTIPLHKKQVDPMETGFSLDVQFVPSLMKLAASDISRVMKAIDKYTKAPESPGLNLEQLKGRIGKRRLWTIRASQELRTKLCIRSRSRSCPRRPCSRSDRAVPRTATADLDSRHARTRLRTCTEDTRKRASRARQCRRSICGGPARTKSLRTA